MTSNQLTCLLVLLMFLLTTADNSETYRAATVEYEPYFEQHINPNEILIANAKKYAEYASEAAQQKAIIVVFPEYGLPTLELWVNSSLDRHVILPYLQTIPDPKEVLWNPCLNPADYNQTDALHVLSCSARKNSIAILVNILSRENCRKKSDPNCPDDSHYQYNTNVVFDKNGDLIARYHKNHLFSEEPLNSPRQTEYVTFIIDEIEFASFICFDIMYKDPAVELVRDHGIKNIIFSTAWNNKSPFLLAPQLFSSWARGLGVNLIVSNYYKPQYRRLGTGIYSSQLGALNETFDISRKGQLLIADLIIDPTPVPEGQCTLPIQSQASTNNPINNSYTTTKLTDKPSSSPVAPIHRIYYQSIINFTSLYLKESQGNVSICQNGACCNLVYSLSKNNDLGIYALLVFDGILHYAGSKHRMGLQTCSLMRCEKENDIESCGRVPITTPLAEFDKLLLIGQLEAEVVFPSVVKGDLQLLSSNDWSFSIKNCEEKKTQSKIELTKKSKSIFIASLYARLYERDYDMRY